MNFELLNQYINPQIALLVALTVEMIKREIKKNWVQKFGRFIAIGVGIGWAFLFAGKLGLVGIETILLVGGVTGYAVAIGVAGVRGTLKVIGRENGKNGSNGGNGKDISNQPPNPIPGKDNIISG